MHLKMEGTWETGLLRVSLFGLVVAWLSLLDDIFHIAKHHQLIIVNLTKVATYFGEYKADFMCGRSKSISNRILHLTYSSMAIILRIYGTFEHLAWL